VTLDANARSNSGDLWQPILATLPVRLRTVRYLGIEVDDAIEIAEKIDI
jgi:hypothetical protein